MSEVVFSDKYDPLFRLLQSPDGLKGIDTVLVSGGRDSGKTFALSCWTGLAASEYDHRVLYTRYTMTSTKNSIKEALQNRLELLDIDDEFQFANDDFVHVANEDSVGKITITGQKTSSGNQSAKLKSIENYSVFLTEEGEELTSFEEWKKIKRSIRAQDVQCLSIIVFNPPTKEHWLYKQYYQDLEEGFNGIKNNVMYIHTTYQDNGIDNMAVHNWNEYENLRVVYEYVDSLSEEQRQEIPKKDLQNWKDYKSTILGGFRDHAEGVVYSNWVEGEFDESLPYCYALDYGFSPDPLALIEIAVDFRESVKKIYIREHDYRTELSTDQVCESFDRALRKRKDLIVCDTNESRTTSEIRKRGYNIQEAIKPAVSDNIRDIIGFTIVVTPESENAKIELNNYIWNDKKSSTPIGEYNHILDPMRYGYNRLRLPKSAKTTTTGYSKKRRR